MAEIVIELTDKARRGWMVGGNTLLTVTLTAGSESRRC
jgi:hypothetical protein